MSGPTALTATVWGQGRAAIHLSNQAAALVKDADEECMICRDDVPATIAFVPCSHRVCFACVENMRAKNIFKVMVLSSLGQPPEGFLAGGRGGGGVLDLPITPDAVAICRLTKVSSVLSAGHTWMATRHYSRKSLAEVTQFNSAKHFHSPLTANSRLHKSSVHP
jgi:hypothetical protein